MEIIFETVFGSHLYGTNVETSDRDFKGIFIPTAEEILSPRIIDVVTMNTGSAKIKNSADDIDRELYSVHKFFDMLIKGDMNAYELLFAPVNDLNPVYNKIRSNREKMISRACKGFVGYCRRQANLYSVKGNRLNCVKDVVGFFSSYLDTMSLMKIRDIPGLKDQLEALAEEQEYCQIQYIESGPNVLWNFVCCDRASPDSISIKNAYEMYKRVLDNYGSRANAAATASGADYKALMHAIRVSEQAIELLTTGNITFPRPNAEYLKEIRSGVYTVEELSVKLDQYLAKIEGLIETSTLPENADVEFIKELQTEIYRNKVIWEYEKECS